MFTKPDSFFNEHSKYRHLVNMSVLESIRHTHDAAEASKSQFYICMSKPAIASHPLAKSVLLGELMFCLDTFTAKLAVLAAECRVAVLAVGGSVRVQLNQMDPRQHELANKLPQIEEPFKGEIWEEREKALKADMDQWFKKIMWLPDQDLDGSTNQLIQPVNQSQSHDSDASIQDLIDDTSDINVVECRYMSAKPVVYPIRPPLHDVSLSACVAVDICSSLSACVAVTDIVLNDMPDRYRLTSMAHVSDSRYVMGKFDEDSEVHFTYRLDIDTHKIYGIDEKCYATNIVTRDDILVVFSYHHTEVIYDQSDYGQIEIRCKKQNASRKYISDRWCQQFKDDIYVIDDSDSLYRISWHDVKAHRFDSKCLIDDSVEDFYMHEHGNAILKTTGIIALKNSQTVNMKNIDYRAEWSTVIRSANRWIACGDRKDSISTIASIDDRGVVISTLSICTTAVEEDALIQYLKTAIVKRHLSIILAIENSARCHLISMTASGHLHMLQSMPSLCRPDIEYPDDSYKAINTMTESDVQGQYIVSGYLWIKKLTVSLT